jgi:hypothetical protein
MRIADLHDKVNLKNVTNKFILQKKQTIDKYLKE